MEPLVTVLMPVRNGAATLPATLASLRSQMFPRYRVLIVDDGSTDGSAAVARGVWGEDERLQVVRAAAVGLANALQLGLAACATPFVARMDADDVMHPERLAAQWDFVRANPGCDVVACQVESFGAELAGGFRRYDAWQNALLHHDDIMRDMFVESPLAHPTVWFRRQTVLAVGGYQDPPWPEDYDLWLRLALAGARFGKVPRVLHHWRDAPQRTSRVSPRYRQEAFLRCKAHYLACGPLQAWGTCAVWGAGPIGRRLARALRHAGCGVRAFFDVDPRKIGGTRAGDTPVVDAAERGTWRGLPLVAAVGSAGARAEIRGAAAASGWTEGTDFWCAA